MQHISKNKRTLFVGGINIKTNENDLASYFSEYGSIAKVTIPYGKKENDFKGYAQILFKEFDDVTNCLDKKHVIKGRMVNCKRAQNKTQAQKMTKIKSKKKLFIGGLSKKTTEADLEQYFSKFGKLENIYLIYDKHTHFSRGFGFLEFEDIDFAMKAHQDEGHQIGGRKVYTKFQVLKKPLTSKKKKN